MNFNIIKHLVAADLSRNRSFILLYSLLGIGVAAITLIGGETAFYVSMVLAITCLIGVGLHPIFTLVLMEKKENNFAFVMSLPASYMDYTLAKVLAVYGFALIPWLCVVISTSLIILTMPTIFNGFLGPAWTVAGEMFAAYTIALGAALIFSSEAAIVVAILTSNLGVNFFLSGFLGMEPIAALSNNPEFGWHPLLNIALVGELVFMVLMIAMILVVQSRKRDLL